MLANSQSFTHIIMSIAADEIISGWESNGGKPEQVAMFRFDLAVHRYKQNLTIICVPMVS